MLYKINPPAQRDLFDAIAQLQRTLLNLLCDSTCKSSQITEAWLISHLTTMDSDWLQDFCKRKDTISNLKRPLLEHMRIIADAPMHVKQAILTAFENSQAFANLYDESYTGPSRIPDEVDITGIDQQIWAAIRGLFESFYDPLFYPSCGYRLHAASMVALVVFNRDKFLEQFTNTNCLGVCPMCDGSRGDPEVDHFLPKSKYPFLSLHPFNLLPICSTCNGRSRKGQQIPLDIATDKQVLNWFHPYLRAAEGTYTVGFEQRDNKLTPVLCGKDAQTQIRLINLDKLIGLQERWRQELIHRVRSTLKRIEQHRRRLRQHKLNEEELHQKLEEWAKDAEVDIGSLANSILGKYYLEATAQKQPILYDELWIYASDSDPVTTSSTNVSNVL